LYSLGTGESQVKREIRVIGGDGSETFGVMFALLM
jgi:hypothetical protein